MRPNGSSKVYNYSDQTIGAYELFIAGSWEENTLMLAEANIMLGNTNAGLTLVDQERAYQGAGVATVSGTGLTQAQAYNQLVRERRVALFGRGLSFWDSRRWGWTYDIKQGGGSYGNQILYLPSTGHAVMNVNATFDYNFMDYWDVPADEVILNPPSKGTASVVTNPGVTDREKEIYCQAQLLTWIRATHIRSHYSYLSRVVSSLQLVYLAGFTAKDAAIPDLHPERPGTYAKPFTMSTAIRWLTRTWRPKVRHFSLPNGILAGSGLPRWPLLQQASPLSSIWKSKWCIISGRTGARWRG